MKLPAFLLRGFQPADQIASSALGALERRLLERLWERGSEASVWDVHAALDDPPAYTTLMTTLDRLYKKGLLERRKSGRAFLYRPALQREEFDEALAAALLGGLLNGRGSVRPLLSTIVDAVSQHDHEALDDLERLVRRRRARGPEREP